MAVIETRKLYRISPKDGSYTSGPEVAAITCQLTCPTATLKDLKVVEFTVAFAAVAQVSFWVCTSQIPERLRAFIWSDGQKISPTPIEIKFTVRFDSDTERLELLRLAEEDPTTTVIREFPFFHSEQEARAAVK